MRLAFFVSWTMRERFPENVQPGHKLTTGWVNRVGKVLNPLAHGQPGTNQSGVENSAMRSTSSPNAHVEQQLKITNIERSNENIYGGRLLGYDTDQRDWLPYGDTFDIDASGQDATFSIDAVVICYWDAARVAFIPIKGDEGPRRVKITRRIDPGGMGKANFMVWNTAGAGAYVEAATGEIDVFDDAGRNFLLATEQCWVTRDDHNRWQILGENGLRRRGKTDSSIAANAFGIVSIYRAGVDTTENLRAALDWMHGSEGVSANKEVVAQYYVHEARWAIDQAECEVDEQSSSSAEATSSSSSNAGTSSSSSSSLSSSSSAGSSSSSVSSSSSSSVSSSSSSSVSSSSSSSGGTVEEFTTTGLQTWTAPGGVTLVKKAECWGPGGNGATGSGADSGGGGGGGGYARKNNISVTPSSNYDVFVGGSGSENSSYFINTGTVESKAGQNASGASGGSGSAAGTGDVIHYGQSGGDGTTSSTGGGGGGAAGDSSDGTAGDDGGSGGSGGAGGSNGGGAGGNGGVFPGGIGSSGTNPGGGGGGGGNFNGTAGSGGQGKVRLTY